MSKNYLNDQTTFESWLFTTDHKRIGLLYLLGILFFFSIGGLAAMLIRLELLTPGVDLVQADVYNRLFTMHGVIMVFFFLIPAIPGVLGNFILPLMLGAKDVAFPKLNLMSWYVYMVGGLFALGAILVGGVDTGWTFYAPLSTVYSNSYVVAMGLGIFITGFSSILTGLNFIATIHKMRAPGLTWMRMPLMVWALYATSIIFVLGTPVIAITIVLVALERAFGLGFFNPALGGDPLLFQHLFWFYSHPAVYIMILPAMGVMSEVISCFSRKRVYGYSFVAISSVAIAILGFLVWGHHMFIAGQSVYAGIVFSFLSFLVAIPSAVKVFNWTATLYKGRIYLKAPMLFVLGFLGLFTVGGLTGLFLASLGMDVHITNTYFIVAHFHYIMVGGTIMGFMAGLHFWWPKITGKMYSDTLAKLAAVTIFAGFNITFFPQFLLGFLGLPRRYYMYPAEFTIYNVISTIGAFVLALGFMMPVGYLIYSLFSSKKAGNNPWNASGLEWTTQSPPITHNFESTPTVIEEAYDYSKRQEIPNV